MEQRPHRGPDQAESEGDFADHLPGPGEEHEDPLEPGGAEPHAQCAQDLRRPQPRALRGVPAEVP